MDGVVVWVRGYHSLGDSLTPCFPGAQSRAIKPPTVQLLLVTRPVHPPYSVGNGEGSEGQETRVAGESMEQLWAQHKCVYFVLVLSVASGYPRSQRWEGDEGLSSSPWIS